jgi:hypothetical protein
MTGNKAPTISRVLMTQLVHLSSQKPLFPKLKVTTVSYIYVLSSQKRWATTSIRVLGPGPKGNNPLSVPLGRMAAKNLESFRAAMQTVYGDACNLQGEAAEDWIAPPNSGGHRGRYLWTDAFGVLDFLTLFKETGETTYLVLAKRLVQSVHDILGWTRDGTRRLPGATDQDPLGGGLRIGKLEEGGPDGDGQYHHYLTLWMFALNRLAIASKDQMYNDQAIAMARAIHPHFFIGRTTSSPRMVWKISTDRSRVLVASQGHLDATTGFVVCRLLQATSKEPHILEEEIADYRKIMELGDSLEASNDTLDIGMALWVAHWYAGAEAWAETLARNCIKSLSAACCFLFQRF